MSYRKLLVSIAFIPFFIPWAGVAEASQVATKWYFGNWQNCRIDGRPARMQWRVVDDPQTRCSDGVCSTTSGVKVVGQFSDNRSRWVPLGIRSDRGNTLGIRYLGAEPDNWMLRYNPSTQAAQGYTTWRGQRYPLSCRR